MVADVRGLETGLLGLAGFRLAGTVNKDGEAPAGRRLLSGRGVRLRGAGVVERTAGDRGAGSAFGRAAGGAGVAETPLAVPRPRLRVKSWTEDSEEVRPRSVLSERARREAVSQVGQDGMPAAAAARGLGVSWHTAMNAVREIGGSMAEAQTGGLRGVRRLGMGRGAAGGNARAGGCRGSAASTRAGWWKSFRAVLVLRPGASSAAGLPRTASR